MAEAEGVSDAEGVHDGENEPVALLEIVGLRLVVGDCEGVCEGDAPIDSVAV